MKEIPLSQGKAAIEGRMTKALSERAVLYQVNRILALRHERLSKRRDSGDYRHVDTRRQALLSYPVDLESFARDLGVLADSQSIE